MAWNQRGERVILCRVETSPDDIRGMDAAQGVLTARGGMTSHAALVARQMGKVCIAGCEALQINYAPRTLEVGQTELNEGDWISIDGNTGEVFQGEIQTLPSEILQVLLTRSLDPRQSKIYRHFTKLMKWADQTAQARCANQCGSARSSGHRQSFWQRRHRLMPHRTYVFPG